MAKENKKEVSFVEGPIFQSLIRFALPVLGALILQAAYGAVDLLVVGWFGDASSISAVGTGSNFMQMVTLIITSLAMGSTVMIGQHIGEGKPDKAGKPWELDCSVRHHRCRHDGDSGSCSQARSPIFYRSRRSLLTKPSSTCGSVPAVF